MHLILTVVKEGGGSSAGQAFLRMQGHSDNPMHKQLMYKPEAWQLIYTGEGMPLQRLRSQAGQVLPLRSPFYIQQSGFMVTSKHSAEPQPSLVASTARHTPWFLQDRWGPRGSLFLKSCPAPGSLLGTSQVTSSTPSATNSEDVPPFRWLPSPRGTGPHGFHSQWANLLLNSTLTDTAHTWEREVALLRVYCVPVLLSPGIYT